MPAMKIAIIGAGSVGFTRKLVTDVLCVPELQDVDIALTDINERNLAMVREILETIVAVNRLPTRIAATADRRRALEGARYVINCVRIGGLEAFADDIRIPLQYGVDQCVGDTICAGGILYGQRSIPAILGFCKDIREVSEPRARLLNYANPMAMNTWAGIDHGKVETIGLCHGIQHGWRQIAEALGADDAREVEYVCCGINHQTWYIDVRFRGRPVGRDELVQAFERHPVYSRQEKVRIDVLKRFGVYSTESNGHLSEYLPWYRKRPDEINRWIDMSEWIHGETGGYLRHCVETRNWFETEFPAFLEEVKKPIDVAARTDEHASHIIEAMETGRPYRGHFNVKNNGLVTNLAADAVVESPGSSIVSASTWRPASPYPWRAPPLAPPRSTCSGWRSKPPSPATSICSSSRFCTIRWSARSARPTKCGAWSTRCSWPRPPGCRNTRTPSATPSGAFRPRRRGERSSGARRAAPSARSRSCAPRAPVEAKSTAGNPAIV